MDYEEEQTWPLSSDTTCYTGAAAASSVGHGEDKGQDVCWATQRHTCRIRFDAKEDNNDDNATSATASLNAQVRLDAVTTPTASSTSTEPRPYANEQQPQRPPVPTRRGIASLQLQSRPILISTMAHEVDCDGDDDVDDLSSHNGSERIVGFHDDSNHICVGYSATREWEALALLDETGISVALSSEPAVQSATAPPSTSNPVVGSGHRPTSSSSDFSFASIVSSTTTVPLTATSGTTTGSRQHHHHARSSSFASLSESSILPPKDGGGTIVGSSAMVDPTAGRTTNMGDLTDLTLTFDEVVPPNPPPPLALPLLSAAAAPHGSTTINALSVIRSQLVVRQRCDASNSTSSSSTREFCSTLDFRPLAVTLFDLERRPNNIEGMDTDATGTTEPLAMDDGCPGLLLPQSPHLAGGSRVENFGVWLGSADDCQLRLLVPSSLSYDLLDSSGTGNNERSLVPVALNDAAFAFATPVMAISHSRIVMTRLSSFDPATTTPVECLAVACQDGTIRLIVFEFHRDEENRSLSLTNVRYNEVIVDGPIVCVCARHARRRDNGSTMIHVTAGSLCGYATELYVNIDTMEMNGPFMIAASLWNARLNAEDAVLAVHSYDDGSDDDSVTAVGTQAGRCLVFQKVKAYNDLNREGSIPTPSYQLQWDCQLPHSIHGLTFSANGQRLVVTTRRSAHVFKKTRHDDTGHIVAAASRAKTRLLEMLQKSKSSDLVT